MKSTSKIIAMIAMWSCALLTFGQDKEAEAPKPVYEGLQFKVNDNWKIKFSGLVNTFYTNIVEQKDTKNNAPGGKTYNSIQNGLNGALLMINPTYTEGNTTIRGNFMISMGINSHGLYGNQDIAGFTFSSVDVRQASATVSNTKWGSVTFGRDFGLLGLDAVLRDVTFLGVGAGWNFKNPSYVTLAGIGYGYVFVDKFAQATYTSPKLLDAVTLSLGVYEPYKLAPLPLTKIPEGSKPDKPDGLGTHAKVTFTKPVGGVDVYLSSSFSTQNISEYTVSDVTSNSSITSNHKLRGYGIDGFANLGLKGFNLSGYYYYGDGTGSDGFMFRPIVQISPANVQKVKTMSYYGQLTYKTSNAKPWTFGVIYGSTTTGDVISGTNLKDEDPSTRLSGVLGFQVSPYLALRSEYTMQDKGLFTPKANTFVLGGTFYF